MLTQVGQKRWQFRDQTTVGVLGASLHCFNILMKHSDALWYDNRGKRYILYCSFSFYLNCSGMSQKVKRAWQWHSPCQHIQPVNQTTLFHSTALCSSASFHLTFMLNHILKCFFFFLHHCSALQNGWQWNSVLLVQRTHWLHIGCSIQTKIVFKVE